MWFSYNICPLLLELSKWKKGKYSDIYQDRCFGYLMFHRISWILTE